MERGSSTPPKLGTPAGVVGERCGSEEGVLARDVGATTSENAGMSSEQYVRTIFTGSLRFPTEGQSASG